MNEGKREIYCDSGSHGTLRMLVSWDHFEILASVLCTLVLLQSSENPIKASYLQEPCIMVHGGWIKNYAQAQEQSLKTRQQLQKKRSDSILKDLKLSQSRSSLQDSPYNLWEKNEEGVSILFKVENKNATNYCAINGRVHSPCEFFKAHFT